MRFNVPLITLLLVLSIALPSCATALHVGSVKKGQASWYGESHQGNRTASGEIFDLNKLTAAHKTLPMGSQVRVTSLSSGRSVVVRINDRGPFTKGRILDVSEAAAKQLGFIKKGTDQVRMEVVSIPGQ
ncbi:septal ring lytic transglycosylase RlpA family protein [Bdellovibrio sp. SKB1291214]|uniref:septal ring lytic transglycosylase RlpA family protein n=1 Tax=Bdellovibrio sp. SKB1291214 TaxID=1732569 RepID=UPI000B51DC54|nr:septal ring lytic transglycosylase RlpA family protein [Bdellovibrio sp. SKB1291214]UYL07268.1 septal ring lytic transglycosylase RlpA family protein [Bdellovibrio sp. SKB1291214]